MDHKPCSFSHQRIEVTLSVLQKDEPLLDKILAPFVAHFGSFESASYLVGKDDKNVILVLVNSCIINKIPHFVMICDGNKIFPVRLQTILGEKADEDDVIFNPLDFGECFVLPSVNSDTHTNPADLTKSEPLSEVICRKNKSKQICISQTGTAGMDSDWSPKEIRGYKSLRLSGQTDVIGRDPTLIDRTWEQILDPPSVPKSYSETVVDPYRRQVTFHDCDLSAEERSRQPFTSNLPVPKAKVKSTTPSHIHILASSSHVPEFSTYPVVCKETTQEEKGSSKRIYPISRIRKSLHCKKPLLVYERRSKGLLKVSEHAIVINHGEPLKVKSSPDAAHKPKIELKDGSLSPGQKSELSDHCLMDVVEHIGTTMGLEFAANKDEFLKLMESLNSKLKDWLKHAPGQEFEEVLRNLRNNPRKDQVS